MRLWHLWRLWSRPLIFLLHLVAVFSLGATRCNKELGRPPETCSWSLGCSSSPVRQNMHVPQGLPSHQNSRRQNSTWDRAWPYSLALRPRETPLAYVAGMPVLAEQPGFLVKIFEHLAKPKMWPEAPRQVHESTSSPRACRRDNTSFWACRIAETFAQHPPPRKPPFALRVHNKVARGSVGSWI